MMNRTPIVVAVIMVLVGQFACLSTPGTTVPGGGTPSSIGTVNKLQGSVRAGPESSMQDVDPTLALNNDDAVQLTNDGKAKLDFGGGLAFTLYNNTNIGGTSLDASGTSLQVSTRLAAGGLNGDNPPGSRTTVSLPTGAQIVILGTRYFITYDPTQDVAWVYNFDGTVQYSIAGGASQDLPRRALVEFKSTQVIEVFGDQKFTPDDFDKLATDLGSPIEGLVELRRRFEVANVGPTDTPVPTPVGGGTGLIAYMSDEPGNLEVFTRDLGHFNVVNVTRSERQDSNPAWSPDGSQIAYVSDPDGPVIFVTNADGSKEPQQLTDYRNDTYPAWSPDGQKLAFVSQRDENAEVYVLDMSDPHNTQVNLTNNPAWDADPCWSPDGSQIAFTSNRDGDGFQIYVMNADGSNQRRLSNNEPLGSWNSFPDWSHDGARIAFQQQDSNKEFQIFVMSADGNGDAVQLTHKGDNEGARWSPDDRLIAFTSTRAGTPDIFLMNADGSEQTSVTKSGANESAPAWQP